MIPLLATNGALMVPESGCKRQPGRRSPSRDRHVRRRRSNGAAGIIDGLRAQTVGAGAHVVPREAVRRRGNCAEQRRAVIELNLTDRVAVGGDIGGKADGGRRREDCPIGRRSQRDNGSIVRGEGDRVTHLAGIVALQSIGIVSGDGEEIGDATDQV